MALRSEVMKKIKVAREAKIHPMEFEIESSDKVKSPSSPTMSSNKNKDTNKRYSQKQRCKGRDRTIQDMARQDNKQHKQYKTTQDNNTRQDKTRLG
jgi:hypothetical protein